MLSKIKYLGVFLATMAIVALGVYGLANAQFKGPDDSPGVGGGAIKVDRGDNVSIGTSTVLSDTRLLLYATSTGASNYAIRAFNRTEGPVFIVRNDGRVTINTADFSNITASSTNLRVAGAIESTAGGFVFPDGTVQTTAGGGGSSSTTAADVASGEFGANTGHGNYTFKSGDDVANTVTFIAGSDTANPGTPDMKVGIGTASPVAPLQIANNVATGALDTFGEYQMLLYQGGTATSSYGLGIRGSTLVLNTFRDVDFDEKGSTVATIQSGNLGIGTASPSSQLHLLGSMVDTAAIDTTTNNYGGSIILEDTDGGVGAGGAILFSSHGGDKYAAIKGLITNATNNGSGDIAFSTRNTTSDVALTERVRIKDSGNVGIGTASPGEELEVVGSDETTIEVRSTGAGSKANISITNDAQTWQWRMTGNDDLWLNDVTAGGGTAPFQVEKGAGSNTLVVDSNSRVGIGTASPSAQLDVNGIINVNSNRITSVATPTAGSDAATKGYVDAAVSDVQVCRFDSLFGGNIDGNTGPCSGFTWQQCALQGCSSVDSSANVNYSCEGTTLAEAHDAYYSLQTECSDGVCDTDYEIGHGNFLCAK